MATMREDMVENGLKFLRHPNVQTTPLSERVSFLEQKGMTKEEIQEAIERFQNGDAPSSASSVAAPTAAPAYAQPQMMMQAPQQQQQMLTAPMAMAAAAPMQQLIRKSRYPPYIRVLWTISSLVGAASILTFMWNYAVQSGYIPWLRTPLMLTAAKVKEDEAENARKDDALMAGLADVSGAIQTQTNELAKLCASLDQGERDVATKSSISTQIAASLAEQSTNQAIAELKAEVSTLKALLVAKNESQAVVTTAAASSASIEAASAVTAANAPAAVAPVAPPPPPTIVSKAEKMESTLKLIRTQNSLEQLKLAAGILTMYVKNLVENPDVPRYRRIAPGNANFKQKVEPLKHHDELLKSIGFETNGLNMEWKWHTADRASGEFDDNLAVLRAALKALQSLTSASALSSLSLEEIAHESLEQYRQQKTAAAKGESMTAAAAAAPAIAVTANTTPAFTAPNHDLNSFMARLEKKASVSDSFAKKPVMAAATASEPRVAEIKAEATTAVVAPENEDDIEEKLPASAAAIAAAEAERASSAPAAAGPAYPKSFNEVMELIQKGEKVPGIKEIEEKLSVDSDTFLASATAADGESDGELVAQPSAPSKPWEKAATQQS